MNLPKFGRCVDFYCEDNQDNDIMNVRNVNRYVSFFNKDFFFLNYNYC